MHLLVTVTVRLYGSKHGSRARAMPACALVFPTLHARDALHLLPLVQAAP